MYVCIFVYQHLRFGHIDLTKYSMDQDIEISAVTLKHIKFNICILSVYRAPSSNFAFFVNKLDIILKSRHSTNLQYIICGDINVNCLAENCKKLQLDALLTYPYLILRVLSFRWSRQHTRNRTTTSSSSHKR